MPEVPTPAAAARVIQDGSDESVAGLWNLVQETAEDVKPLLADLSSHADPVVRGWAVSAIGATIREAGEDILVDRARRDRDGDVRSIAIQQLLDLNVDEARKLARRYRRRLKSKDVYEPVDAMWMLASVGDRQSLDDIKAIREHAERGFHRKVATVVVMLLEDRGDEILACIGDHNHDLMPWLAKGARILGTPEALAVLQRCANGPFDDECKWACREEAAELERRIRTSAPDSKHDQGH